MILELLKEAERTPVARPVDAKKLARTPLFKAQRKKGKTTIETVVSVPDTDEEARETTAKVTEEVPSTAATQHTEIQYDLLKLGSEMGLDVWVARNDKTKVCNGQSLGSINRVVAELPTKFNEATNRTIELIDVLWLRGNSIVAAFEIECTTAIYSGLLRMSDLLALQPNLDIRLYLVAPEERRGDTRMLFPRLGNAPRVSEQEARFAFVAALAGFSSPGGLLFAVENPTSIAYRFKNMGVGTKATRARTDVALYDAKMPVLNVEFKASGRSEARESFGDISKDMAKLVAERVDGMWFHVLRRANNSTIKGLLAVLGKQLAALSDSAELASFTDPDRTAKPEPKRLIFHICVLDPTMRTSIHRVLEYSPADVPHGFFKVECAATKSSLNVAPGQGWSVNS